MNSATFLTPSSPRAAWTSAMSRVRLTAAELGVETKDRRRFPARAAQAAAYVGEQVLEPASREGGVEETGRVLVLVRRGPANHLRKVGGEVRLGDRTREDVRAGFAGVENRWRHGS